MSRLLALLAEERQGTAGGSGPAVGRSRVLVEEDMGLVMQNGTPELLSSVRACAVWSCAGHVRGVSSLLSSLLSELVCGSGYSGEGDGRLP